MLPTDGIRPFHNHPFHLYEGERLQDMVESVKEHGILNPVIVRKYNGTYEMLSGHNRQNAARIAGIAEIPAIMKEKLSEEEAYVYVIETNLMQRSFTDLTITEKAAVLAERYDKVLYQRKREEIMAEIRQLQRNDLKGGHCDHHFEKNRDGLGKEYGLSGSSVARLLRVNELIPEMKDMLDKGEIQLMAAVQLSFLPEKGQQLALKASQDSGVAINRKIAENLRKTPMIEKNIYETVAGPQPVVDPVLGVIAPPPVYKPVKLPASMREKYFADMEQKEIEEVLDKLLAAWLKRKKRQEQ